MKIAFFSNFLNHHQLPLCLELYSILGDDFTFVATQELPQSRIDLGYHNMNTKYPFCLCAYLRRENQKRATEIANTYDVIVTGSAPLRYTEKRIKDNKLTFRYSERLFKKSEMIKFNPRVIFALLRRHTLFRNKNLYLLCASAYTAKDLSYVAAYPNKMYKWGYYPESKDYDVEKLMAAKAADKIKILWAGRFLDWKHAEDAVEVMKMLAESGYNNCELNIIGTGDRHDSIVERINRYHLNHCVHLLGSMKPEEVRAHMEKADIYLFTSDRNEGWGAVLNEAMNSGCAVVASHTIGAVPYLVKNYENGIIYESGNLQDLFNKTTYLMDHKEERIRISKNAVQTICETWNAKQAADRLIETSRKLLEGKSPLYDSGPMSKANVISEAKVFKDTRKEDRR